MKTRLSFLTLAALPLVLASCTTTKKNRTTGGESGRVNLLAAAEPITEADVQSLKAIADSPASMLPASSDPDETVALGIESKPIATRAMVPAKPVPDEKWKRPGINPEEVNPGDIFGENAGPVLNKALSLADELPSAERRSLLNHFTTIKTSRVPMTISRREINELQKLAGAGMPLPSRSVSFDFRSENRSVAAVRLEELFAQVGRGDSVEAVESKDHQTRLRSQIASVKKRLQAGERLFIVTAVTESEGVTASYPGAPINEEDTELVSNVLKARYPHLTSIAAQRKDDSIQITGNPRILWEFETSEIVLKDDQLVIDSQSVAQL